MIEAGIARQNRFIGNRGIIKRQGADKEPIAGDPMGLCRMRAR
jgi:hypothetical protein